MPINQAQHRKKSAPPQRPFPWRCHECARVTVELGNVSYEAQARHDGRLYEFTIPKLEIPICQACGAKVFTQAVDEQVNAALREHLNLLSPQQIRDGLERVGTSQKEMATRLGIAEATLSRWVNATQIQSRSLDTLLRIYFGFPLVRKALVDHAQDPLLGLSDFTSK